MADFDQAIQLKPEFAEAYSIRGTAKEQQGDPKGAALDYEECLRLTPQQARGPAMRKFIRKHLGRESNY